MVPEPVASAIYDIRCQVGRGTRPLRQGTIWTGVPVGASDWTCRNTLLSSRTQPLLAAWPSRPGALVPWRAIWPSPPPHEVYTSEKPDMASCPVPYGPVGSVSLTLASM